MTISPAPPGPAIARACESSGLEDTTLPVHADLTPAPSTANGKRGEGNGGLFVGAVALPALPSDTKLDAVGAPAAGRKLSVTVRTTTPGPTIVVVSSATFAPKSTSKTASLVPDGSCVALSGGGNTTGGLPPYRATFAMRAPICEADRPPAMP